MTGTIGNGPYHQKWSGGIYSHARDRMAFHIDDDRAARCPQRSLLACVQDRTVATGGSAGDWADLGPKSLEQSMLPTEIANQSAATGCYHTVGDDKRAGFQGRIEPAGNPETHQPRTPLIDQLAGSFFCASAIGTRATDAESIGGGKGA